MVLHKTTSEIPMGSQGQLRAIRNIWAPSMRDLGNQN